MIRNIHQKTVMQALKCRPIAYLPALAKKLNSVTAGLFLSQLLYWQGRGKDPEWSYKTVADIEEELGLTKAQQQTAVAKMKALGFVEVKYKGRIPKTRHFKVNVPVIIRSLQAVKQ